jgi:hypothetical protein
MSCLFDSISRLINIPTDDVRKQICDYLATDKPILDGMKTHDLLELECPHYISQMRHSNTWGGAIEIQAAVQLWNFNIAVQNRRDAITTTIDFIATEPIGTLTLSWTGSHYEPVAIDLDS